MTEKLKNPFKINELITAVNSLVDDKQDTLVSGTNIKTINGSSVLGNGNLTVTADTNDCVHKTGDETITGTKTISTELLLYQLNSTSDHMHFIRGSVPSSGTGKGIYIPFEDYDNVWHKIMSDFNFKVVSTLPAYPNSNIYYFIPE